MINSSLTGDNGRIEYSITSGGEDSFDILTNGTIFTRQLLDRETKSSYNLVVTARDCSKDVDKRLSSTVQVNAQNSTLSESKLISFIHRSQ